MFSESIKSIRTNLQFSAIDKELKTILLTSPEAGNGKSFVSANLAVAYAQDGKRVLIIDCDLRRGRQHGIFNVMNQTNGGYSNLILNYKEEVKLSRYVVKTEVKNIDLIPTGPTPPNPIELLASHNNERVIGELRQHYDIIILDCPPSLSLITINALSASDSVVVPMQCEYFALGGLSQLIFTIKQVRRLYNPELDLLGVILTMYDGRLNLTVQVMEEVKKHFPGKLLPQESLCNRNSS